MAAPIRRFFKVGVMLKLNYLTKMAARVLAGLMVMALAAEMPAAAMEGPMTDNTDALMVTGAHPRIFLDEARLERLREKVEGKSLGEIREEAGRSAVGRALVYAITGDRDSGREAVRMALDMRGRGIRDIEAVALTYDWCHDLLEPDEKAAMLERLAGAVERILESQSALRSFHNGMYTMGWTAGSAALAIYGEHPAGERALDFLIPEYEDALKVFRHVFYDGAWGEGFCYNHHISVKALKFFLALESASGLDMVGRRSPYLENNGYYMIHGTKPNGLVYPGQDNDFSYINDRDREGLLLMNVKWRNPHYQYFLNHCTAELFAFPEELKWKDLLWYDPSIVEEPLEHLPLSRIFRGEGLVFARSAWLFDGAEGRSPDTWLSFKCGNYYGDHAHFDSNAFEIYHRGELAIDSGRYDDDWGLEEDSETVKTSQFFNYYQRTIAHNTMLVYNPDERMEMDVVNDGGQRGLLRVEGVHNAPKDYDQGTFPAVDSPGGRDWVGNRWRWDTGEILAYKNTEAFMYVCGDATKSYSPGKLDRFVRQLVFIRPNIVVVFDRVVSTKPEFKKTWLLHSVTQPLMTGEGGAFEIINGDGRLLCVPLLPEKRNVETIGGAGNEFLVGGIHYACGPEASSGRTAELHYGEIPGAWRVEISPEGPAHEDYFLNVLEMSDADSKTTPTVEIISDTDASVALRVETAGVAATITFAKGMRPSARLDLESGGDIVHSGPLPDEVVLEEGRP